MPDYQHSNAQKLELCDSQYPSSGLFGYLAILDNNLLDNAGFSVDASSDTLIFSAENKLVTGSRIRLISTTTLPGGLLSNTDYYAIGLSTTEIQLASSLANAINGTAVNITDAGSGTLKAFEQELTAMDGIGAILAHELISTAYTERFPIENLGPASIVSGEAQKAPWIQLFTNNTSNTIVSGYRVLIRGGGSSIGSSGSDSFSLHQEVLTMYAGETKSFTVLFTRN